MDGGQSYGSDNSEMKIFVGGLSWESTVKDLREYFEKYGPVTDATLKTDPATGRSRGFGFVTFEDSSTVDKVVAEKNHTLHGKHIDPKRALARGQSEPIKKIFVGGIDPNMPEGDIREFFSQFGKIEDVDLPFDKMKNQRRGFCFVTFDSEQTVEAVVGATGKQTINGKQVDVKKATPQGARGGRGGGFSERGGGRGGGGGFQQGGWSNGNQGSSGYDYNNYYSQGGYGGANAGYDYSGYGGGQYDYTNYYQQPSSGGWGGYDQSGYGQQSSYGQQGDQGYGKAKTGRGGGGGGGAGASQGYHPYSRS